MVSFTVVRSARARHIRITIFPNGEVKVTAPRFADQSTIDRFVRTKQSWIEEKVSYFKKRQEQNEKMGVPKLPDFPVAPDGPKRGSIKDFVRQKTAVTRLVNDRLEYFSKVFAERGHPIRYGRISIRNQSSRWGSCSAKGNLNFNYQILYLPPVYQDYIFVHELCHLIELNHGPRFWSLMEKILPGARQLHQHTRRIRLG